LVLFDVDLSYPKTERVPLDSSIILSIGSKRKL